MVLSFAYKVTDEMNIQWNTLFVVSPSILFLSLLVAIIIMADNFVMPFYVMQLKEREKKNLVRSERKGKPKEPISNYKI